jgi:hypothetical protein
MAETAARRMVTGEVMLTSPWLSSEWRLSQDGAEIARVRRHGRLYVSDVALTDGTKWLIEPSGPGIVCAVEDPGAEIARVVRRSWIGRRWDLTSQQFAYELISDPRPRRWYVSIGGAPAAEISGSLVSYNKVRVMASIGVPLVAVLLAWHVIARPWEAAAEPRGLVPSRTPRPPDLAFGGMS